MANVTKNETLLDKAVDAAYTRTPGKWMGLHNGGPKHEYPKGEPRMPKNLIARVKHYDKTQSGSKGFTRPGSNKK